MTVDFFVLLGEEDIPDSFYGNKKKSKKTEKRRRRLAGVGGEGGCLFAGRLLICLLREEKGK